MSRIRSFLLLSGALLLSSIVAAKPVYIKAGRMIDVADGRVLSDRVIVVDGERIERVGSASSISIPADADVIDLRVLRPLDDATIMASIAKTRRAIIVDEGWRSGSISAEISARIMEQGFWDLDAPVGRVCSAEVPIPYPKHLEDAAIPQVPAIVAAAKAALGR